MVKPLENQKGMTLVELMIAALLTGVVFAGVTAAYVSSIKFLNAAKTHQNQVNAHISLEIISRKVALANQVSTGTTSSPNDKSQMTLRWDYTLGTFQPNGPLGTPLDNSDDTFLKYRIVNGRLYWRNDPVSDARDVLPADSGTQELLPGFILSEGSLFEIVPDTPNRVHIRWLVPVGIPPKNIELFTDVSAHATSL